MAISFDTIPTGTRVPFTFVEISGSKAVQGPSVQPYQVLLVGQLLPAGSASAGDVLTLTEAAQAATLFGAGSQLHRMAVAAFAQGRDVQVLAVGQADPAGAAATATLAVTGTATAAGTLYLYLNGQRLQVAVANSDTAAAVGDAIVAAVTAATDLPVTASDNDAGVVTLTAKNAGVAGNDLDVRLNMNQGEELPTGIAVAVAGFSGGSGSPDYTALWSALETYAPNIWAVGDTSAANLTALDTELEDRFGPIRQDGAVAFAGLRDTHANLVTTGDGQNSRHLSLTGANASPTQPCEWAAATAMVVAMYGQRDPARPFQTLPLRSIVPPAESDRFSWTERNLLLADGISTWTVDDGGVVRLERCISTYQTNAGGAPDPSFLDVNTHLTLDFLRYDLRVSTQLKFPRHKLKGETGTVPAGQPIVTPLVYRAFVTGKFRQWEERGLVEDADQFVADLVVEINSSDPTRLDVLVSPNLVNQLRQTAVQIAFLL